MNRLRLLVLAQNLTIRNQPKLACAQARNSQSIRRFSEERENFGTYNVILPPEPFVFGVDHIQPRVVPDHIVRPPYARDNSAAIVDIPIQDSGKIKLGGEAELKIRKAALLAKEVREFVSTLVKVRRCCYILGCVKEL